MDHYLIIKTMVDREENISTEVVLKYKKFEAEVLFHSLIDKFYEEIHGICCDVQYDEFVLEECGDVKRGKNYFEFKDREGDYNVKIELKILN